MGEPRWGAVDTLAPAAGRLLVATPLLTDPNFARTVVYLLEHDGGGTVGVVLNRPSHTPVAHVLPAWQEAVSGPEVVFNGGPVRPDGALCLGLLAHETSGMRTIVDGVATVDLDGEVDVIAPIARRLRIFAGHSGWSPGQLEHELAEDAWWVLPGGHEDLFSQSPRSMWRDVLRRQRPPLSLISTLPEDPSLN